MRRPDAALVADLWFFVHAARLCSFSGAARQLNVTQGAVSQRVHRLEMRLEAALFLRRGTRLSLTAAGRTLYDSATAAFDAIAEGLAKLSPQRSGQSVVVSCLPSLAIEWLVPRLGEFYSRHPAARVEVRAEFSGVTVESMEQEGADVAIRYDQEPHDPLLEFTRVAELVFPVCSKRYASRVKKKGKWCLLCDSMPWEGAARLAEWECWRRGPDRSSVSAPDGQRFYNLAHMAYAAALEDQGVAIGRGALVHRYLSEGTLIAVPGLPCKEIANYRILLRRRERDGLASTFANWIAAELERTRAEVQALLTTRPGRARMARTPTGTRTAGAK